MRKGNLLYTKLNQALGSLIYLVISYGLQGCSLPTNPKSLTPTSLSLNTISPIYATSMTASATSGYVYNSITIDLGPDFLSSNICAGNYIFGKQGLAICNLSNFGAWDMTTPFPGVGQYSSLTNSPASTLICAGQTFLGSSTSAVCQSPAPSNSTSAVPADVVSGNRFWDSTGISRIGLMPNRGAWDLRTTFPGSGYYSSTTHPLLNSEICLGNTIIGIDGTAICQYSATSNPATAMDLLFGTECWNASGTKMTGTLPNRGVWNLTTTFPDSGYYSSVYNYPTNSQICSNQMILGVTGSALCQQIPSALPTPATSIEVVSGYDFWNSTGTLNTGSMNFKGALNLDVAPSATPSPGYYSSVTSSMSAEAICQSSGKKIFNQVGTANCDLITNLPLNYKIPINYSGGNLNSCLIYNGVTQCVGDNTHGQLGNNTTVSSLNPVTASISQAQKISVGYSPHACAIAQGGVMCWGKTGNQLGFVNASDVLTPTQVTWLSSGSGATQIQAGYQHTCALVNGGVKCWGVNASGELGNNTITASATLVNAIGLTSNVQEIKTGYNHNCALINGGIQCWGNNSTGQIGNNSSIGINVLTPSFVTGLNQGVQDFIVGGSPTGSTGYGCALKNNAVYCWGNNSRGELGIGSTTPSYSLTPLAVSSLTTGVQKLMNKGGDHVCALMTSGTIYCWGSNTLGQIGNGTTSLTPQSTPIALSSVPSGAINIFGGISHSCAEVLGKFYCWGGNSSGQLSTGNTINQYTPTLINNFN